MKRTTSVAIVGTAVSFAVVSLAVVGGVAVAAQDRSTLKVPDGLAFSEFKGYEDWQYVAVSQTATSVKVIAANPVMINAYRQGVPGNHQLFPEGSKIVKIEWLFKEESAVPLFRECAGYAEDAVVHRKRQHAISEHPWLGLRRFSQRSRH